MFEAILTAETPGQMIGYTLDDHLEISTNLFECAVPAVSVILAALAGDLSMLARNHPGTADQAIAAADSLAGPVDPQNASRWGFGIWSAVSWLPRPTWISHFAESLQLALR